MSNTSQSDQTICYTGTGSFPSSQHTIPEFMSIMDKHEKGWCIRDKTRKKCPDCVEQTRLTTEYIRKLTAADGKYKVQYPFKELNVLNNRCIECTTKNIGTTPSCNLDEYIEYSGAVRGECPADTSAPGGAKQPSLWNKFRSFIGAGRHRTKRVRRARRHRRI